MSTTYFALLTNIGTAKLANAAALGTQLSITEMAVGDGGGVLPTPAPTQTALINETRRAPLNMLSIDPDNASQIIAEQVIPESVGGWWIREIGLYDDDGDLVAIANCPETYKPRLQEGSGRVQTVRMILIVSNTEAVTLKIDPSVVLATRSYVDSALLEVGAELKDFVKVSDFSQYGGIASIRDVGRASGASVALFPRLMNKLSAYRHGNQAYQKVFNFVGFGSSVGVGATLPDPTSQAPVARFFEYFNSYLNSARIYPLQFKNYSVNGSFISGFTTPFNQSIQDGSSPDLALFIYGMNDFAPAGYNAGQTFGGANGFSKRLEDAIIKVQAAGGDVVLVTTPHPHSGRMDHSLPPSVDMLWPSHASAPVADENVIPPVSDAIKTINWNGVDIQADHRFLRGNDAIRKTAVKMKVLLIDAEKYWFDAVSKYGEDALFDIGQINHPNELGHENSFCAAFIDFFKSTVDCGWTPPNASSDALLDVGGGGVYPNPTGGDISLMASGVRENALVEYDKYGRPLRKVSHEGVVSTYFYTSKDPASGSAGYTSRMDEQLIRSGVQNEGEVIDFVIPHRAAVDIIIDVFTPNTDLVVQTSKILANNRNGKVIFSTYAENITSASGTLFTLSAVDNTEDVNAAALRMEVKINNSVYRAAMRTLF